VSSKLWVPQAFVIYGRATSGLLCAGTPRISMLYPKFLALQFPISISQS